jgi:hypothetical protein
MPIKYNFSKTLNMKYRTRETEKGMRLQTEDKIIYNESETALLYKNGLKITKEIHMIKNIFNGEIVGVG